MSQQYQVRFVQIPRWAAALTAVAAIAFAVALFLLSVTVFLVLLPVIAIAGGIYYLFGRRRNSGRGSSGSAEIIEGEYRVVKRERVERDREQRS